MPRPTPRGRGAAIDPVQRFTGREVAWDGDELDFEEATGEGAPERTRVFRDASRSVLSHNTSPDIPFDVSLNPYRGCEHGCSYCLSPETRITMADGQARRLDEIAIGDRILGTAPGPRYRHLIATDVRDVWRTRRRAYRVELDDGTVLVASGDHRFLTHRGWKHVIGAQQGAARRPHLTPRDVLMGVGGRASLAGVPLDDTGPAYRLGYLTGIVRGDGTLGVYEYGGRRRTSETQHVFRLAMVDLEALDRATRYLEGFGVPTTRWLFQRGSALRAPVEAIGTRAAASVARVRELIEVPDAPPTAWSRGFVAGFFDAEGGTDGATVRFFNTDSTLVEVLRRALERLELTYVVEKPRSSTRLPGVVVRLTGGLPTTLRMFDSVRPAVARKRRFGGAALKRAGPPIRVARIIDLGNEIDMIDLTTGTGDFIAEGIVSHNCYARPTHEYLGLSAGLDFERRIFAKPDAPALLAAELRKPSWRPRHIALSGVTDPYQPVERLLGITRGCLEVLAAHRHPVGLITKNALVVRDLDLLAELARWGAVRVAVSITTLDEDLRRKLEPRTSTARARLEAIRTLTDAGVPVGVNVAPVIPGLNDREVPAILAAAADHGAQGAAWTLLRLPGAVEPIFVDWVHAHAPLRADRILARVRETRGGALSDARFGHRHRGDGVYARQLAQLFDVHRRRTGLDRSWPPLAVEHFRVPGRAVQGALFEDSTERSSGRGAR